MIKQYKFKPVFMLFAFILLSFVSCTGDQNTDKDNEAGEEVSNVEVKEEVREKTIEITLNSNDEMKYDKEELNVFEGQEVTLNLVHTGTMTIEAMGHNFVLLAPGTDIAEFAMLAMEAKDTEYIPANKSSIIAFTGLIGGGEKTSTTFIAPEKGTYDYICTFPGHYGMMKGKLNVK